MRIDERSFTEIGRLCNEWLKGKFDMVLERSTRAWRATAARRFDPLLAIARPA